MRDGRIGHLWALWGVLIIDTAGQRPRLPLCACGRQGRRALSPSPRSPLRPRHGAAAACDQCVCPSPGRCAQRGPTGAPPPPRCRALTRTDGTLTTRPYIRQLPSTRRCRTTRPPSQSARLLSPQTTSRLCLIYLGLLSPKRCAMLRSFLRIPVRSPPPSSLFKTPVLLPRPWSRPLSTSPRLFPGRSFSPPIRQVAQTYHAFRAAEAKHPRFVAAVCVIGSRQFHATRRNEGFPLLPLLAGVLKVRTGYHTSYRSRQAHANSSVHRPPLRSRSFVQQRVSRSRSCPLSSSRLSKRKR